jgi:hypothetical protein
MYAYERRCQKLRAEGLKPQRGVWAASHYSVRVESYGFDANAQLRRAAIASGAFRRNNQPREHLTMKYDCIKPLLSVGVEYEDAQTLRRIAMTLHRWHEMECGTDMGVITRDETTNKTYFHNYTSRQPYPTPDRESAALKRLDKLMARYPTLSAYVQGDPRGAALYILRPGDVPEGKDADAYYSRGIAVYK